MRQPGEPERTLRAGEVASAADQALAVQYGAISFYRIKNSWGPGPDPSGTGTLQGYSDLQMNDPNRRISWAPGTLKSPRPPLSCSTLPPGSCAPRRWGRASAAPGSTARRDEI